MAKAEAYAVFILPVIFTVVFSTAVLAGALDTMDREINMWPGKSHKSIPHSGGMTVIGLLSEYEVFDTIKFHVDVTDARYDCGALDILVYNSDGDIVEERTYDSQCFMADSLPLPIEGFATKVDVPGSYTLTVTISVGDDRLLTSAIFNVG